MKVLDGQGRRQATVSMSPHAAVSGARTPGWRSGTLKPPEDEDDADEDDDEEDVVLDDVAVGALEQP